MAKGNIIGISFDEMNATKKKLHAARMAAEGMREYLTKGINELQVDDYRLRQKSEELRAMRSKVENRINELQRLENHIDHVVKRFKEVDSECAKRISSRSHDYNKTLGLPDTSVLGVVCDALAAGAKVWWEANTAPYKFLAEQAQKFYNEHKVIIDNIANIALETTAIVLTVAALTALSATGVGLIVVGGIAAAGIAYSASNIVDSGTKIYNYCTTGKDIGFNPLERGFQAVLGEEAGKKAYSYTGLAIGIADIAAGAPSLIRSGKQIYKAVKAGDSVKDLLGVGKMAHKVRALNPGELVDDVKDISKAEKATDDYIDNVGLLNRGYKPAPGERSMTKEQWKQLNHQKRLEKAVGNKLEEANIELLQKIENGTVKRTKGKEINTAGVAINKCDIPDLFKGNKSVISEAVNGNRFNPLREKEIQTKTQDIINDFMKRNPEGSKEIWDIDNCAEFDLVNKCFKRNKDAELSDMYIFVTDASGKYKMPCRNCSDMYNGLNYYDGFKFNKVKY